MEQQTRFKIVFEKLAEAQRSGAITEAEVAESARLRAESEEIAELRRVVSEITDPEPKSFTTT
ncbi:MAG TPA: hypothetical protein VF311_03440 [Terriglobales bacterium]